MEGTTAEERIEAWRGAWQERRVVLPLELKRMSLCALPSPVLDFTQLQSLYLEGNDIESLPEDIFFRLPNVKWFDLRNNNLKAIPSAKAYNQCDLRQLLLEGNELVRLPNELGDASRLIGLSLQGNPLEYPPKEVVERGVRAVIKFLYNALYEIEEVAPRRLITPQIVVKKKSLRKVKSLPVGSSVLKLPPIENPSVVAQMSGELMGNTAPVSTREVTAASEELRKYQQYQQRRNAELAKGKATSKTRAAPPIPADIQARAEAHKRALEEQTLGRPEFDGPNIPPPTPYRLPNPKALRESRSLLEQSQALRRQQMQEELRVQKQRDKEALSDWRDQRKQEQRSRLYRPSKEEKVSLPRISAPYGTEADSGSYGTDHKAVAAMQQTATSPTIKERQNEQENREKKLQDRIQRHLDRMKQREAEKLSPRTQLQAARDDLDQALENRQELMKMDGSPEYRLTAFIATLDKNDPDFPSDNAKKT